MRWAGGIVIINFKSDSRGFLAIGAPCGETCGCGEPHPSGSRTSRSVPATATSLVTSLLFVQSFSDIVDACKWIETNGDNSYGIFVNSFLYELKTHINTEQQLLMFTTYARRRLQRSLAVFFFGWRRYVYQVFWTAMEACDHGCVQTRQWSFLESDLVQEKLRYCSYQVLWPKPKPRIPDGLRDLANDIRRHL